jgi:hypothetical protein
MDCMELAGSIIAHTTVLGEAKEIFDELRQNYIPDIAVVETFRGYAIVTTAPTDQMAVLMAMTWADGWLARHRNQSL